MDSKDIKTEINEDLRADIEEVTAQDLIDNMEEDIRGYLEQRGVII